jgi:hypothetical protein
MGRILRCGNMCRPAPRRARVFAAMALIAGLAAGGAGVYSAVELPFVLDASKTSRKYLIESMAGGVALLDYDGDGLLDVYFVNTAPLGDPAAPGSIPEKSEPKHWNRLYRNTGRLRFEDVTEKAGLPGAGYGMGAAAADYDNDGDTDLYVTAYGGNRLYRNEGGRFTDVTAGAGVAGGGWSTSAAWVDADHDGRLDLAVARYLRWDFEDKWCGARKEGYRSYCHPDQFEPATHLLYRNLGNGRFADVSRESRFGTAPGKGLGIAIADWDGDGRIDIAVANDAFPQQLFRSQGGGRFEEVGLERNVAYDDDGRVFSGMGIDFGDYDNDGRPDLIVDALASQRYALFRNTTEGFEYVSGKSGVAAATRSHSGWGLRLGDFDNDGWQDLLVAQGHVMDNIELTQPGMKYREPLVLLRNDGGRFGAAEPAAGGEYAARGMATGDLDNDGTLEAVVCVQGAKAFVLRRAPAAGHWLSVKLRGRTSNRDGIGAAVVVRSSGTARMRTVSTASSYLASNDPRAHFGLGADGWPVTVEVRWPSGIRQRVEGVEVDREAVIVEPAASK